MNRTEMLKRLKAGESPLELSIVKWQDIVDGTGKNLGGGNCALCKTHYMREGCPILERVGGTCVDTPYFDYCTAVSSKQRKKAALKEVEFLKSLRKEVTSK